MSSGNQQKTFVAEVIDMDQAGNFSGRPSDRFTRRVNTDSAIPVDDPAARFLFDDSPAYQNRRNRKRFAKRVQQVALTFLMGMAGAWVVWVTPGMGPLEMQSRLQESLLKNQTEILDLQKSLAQSQAKTIELSKMLETQRNLLEQGEALRRSMLAQIQKSEAELQKTAGDLAASRKRLDDLALTQTHNAAFSRKQADTIDHLRDDLVRVDEQFRQSVVNSQQELANLKSDQLQHQRQELQRFSRLLDTELASLKKSDLSDMRSRMERLAEHVWQEVGRLDGQIVRASATVEKPEEAGSNELKSESESNAADDSEMK